MPKGVRGGTKLSTGLLAVGKRERDNPGMRYELRKLDNGWAVWDTTTNAPAAVEGCWQVALTMEDADDLTDLLNRLDREASANAAH